MVRSLPKRFLVLLALLVLKSVGVAAASSEDVQALAPADLLDPKTGEVGGKRALAVYATEAGQVLSSTGCEVRLVSANDASIELTYLAAQWFAPPPDAYLARLESRASWRISPYPKLFGFSGGPFEGRGKILGLRTVDAGLVTVPEPYRSQPDGILRLIRAEPHVDGDGWAARPMTKRVSIADGDSGALMPVGSAIGAVWDEGEQAFTALSRRFLVQGRRSVVVPLERPTSRSHLVALIDRNTIATRSRDYGIDVSLVGDIEHRPEVAIPTASRAYFFFYDLEPGRYELRVVSGHPFETLAIELVAGKIERIHTWLADPAAIPSPYALPEIEPGADRNQGGEP